MRFPSRSHLLRPGAYAFNAGLIAYVLTTVLAPSLGLSASAQTNVPDTAGHPSVESHEKSLAPTGDPSKINKYDVEYIGRRGIGHGFNLYSVKRERELGQSLAASFDSNTRMLSDAVVNDYINRLALKIVGNSDAEIPFTVKVIDSADTPHAYGLPGGFLYIDSALILASDGEAELVSVMAREIAHVAARHATRALTRKQLWNFAGSVAMLAGPAGIALEDAGGIAGPLSLKKFARDTEYEADLLAIEYTYAAGYDPQALLDALEKLQVIDARRNEALAKIPGYHFASKLPFHSKIAKSFASYPLTEERIQRLHSEIATFLPNRNDYVLDTDEFQEVKSRLLASQTPELRRHKNKDDGGTGPVLRREPEYTSDVPASPNLTTPSEVNRGSQSLASEAPRSELK